MICDRYRELLSAEIDGELTDSERHDLHSHLAECTDCRGRLAAMRERDGLLSSSVVPSPPMGLCSKIRARIGIRERSGPAEPRFVGHLLHRSRAGAGTLARKSVAGAMVGPWGRA